MIKAQILLAQHGHKPAGRYKPQVILMLRADELWYKSQLLGLVKKMRSEAEKEIALLLKNALPGAVVDASPLSGPLSALAKRFGGIDKHAKNLANLAALRALKSCDKALRTNLRNSLGIDISSTIAKSDISSEVSKAVIANVGLIKSIPEKYFDRIENVVSNGFAEGLRWEGLIDAIRHIGDVTESRAKLIARDQMSKMNGSFNEARQTSLGIASYTWQISGDERVRESHAENDGQIFSWNSPPATGHPGQDINCRCVAVPYFDLEQIN